MRTTRALTALSPQAKKLYDELLSETRKFQNYNFRAYFDRKVRQNFTEIEAMDEPQLSAALKKNEELLLILRRQVTLSSFFPTRKTLLDWNKKSPSSVEVMRCLNGTYCSYIRLLWVLIFLQIFVFHFVHLTTLGHSLVHWIVPDCFLFESLALQQILVYSNWTCFPLCRKISVPCSMLLINSPTASVVIRKIRTSCTRLFRVTSFFWLIH